MFRLVVLILILITSTASAQFTPDVQSDVNPWTHLNFKNNPNGNPVDPMQAPVHLCDSCAEINSRTQIKSPVNRAVLKSNCSITEQKKGAFQSEGSLLSLQSYNASA